MSTVFLIPTLLAEDGIEAIPAYVTESIKKCSIFFVENERTTRRFFKLLWKEMVIDDFEWVNMVTDTNAVTLFRQAITDNKNIGIVSEAGCPGVADPGQSLVAIAQQLNIKVQPLTGPNSILLALMASGMNGQQFQFVGYIPIESSLRNKTIKDLENESLKKNCTQIFIETPYRNNQLIEALLKICSNDTQLCIAVNITGSTERIITQSIAAWKIAIPDIHKKPAIFLLYAGK